MEKRWWPFAWRLACFLAIAYGIVPLLIELFAGTPAFEINALYPTAFSLVIIGVFVLINRNQLSNIDWTFSWRQFAFFLAAAALQFIFYVKVKYGTGDFGLTYPTFYLYFSGALFTFGVLFTALAFFQFSFAQRFFRQILLALTITLPYFTFSFMLNQAWPHFSKLIMYSDAAMFKLFGIATKLDFSGADPLFTVGEFTVRIGASCSGVASLVMFTGLYLFVALLDWTKLDKRKLCILFPLGLIGMFLMSIIRIFILMLVGVKSPELALTLFHTNAGWVLFVAYFLGFMYFAYPWLKKVEITHSPKS